MESLRRRGERSCRRGGVQFCWNAKLQIVLRDSENGYGGNDEVGR